MSEVKIRFDIWENGRWSASLVEGENCTYFNSGDRLGLLRELNNYASFQVPNLWDFSPSEEMLGVAFVAATKKRRSSDWIDSEELRLVYSLAWTLNYLCDGFVLKDPDKIEVDPVYYQPEGIFVQLVNSRNQDYLKVATIERAWFYKKEMVFEDDDEFTLKRIPKNYWVLKMLAPGFYIIDRANVRLPNGKKPEGVIVETKKGKFLDLHSFFDAEIYNKEDLTFLE